MLGCGCVGHVGVCMHYYRIQRGREWLAPNMCVVQELTPKRVTPPLFSPTHICIRRALEQSGQERERGGAPSLVREVRRIPMMVVWVRWATRRNLHSS